MMNGGYGYHSGYMSGVYGLQGRSYGVTPILTGLFGLVIHLLFFLLVISIIAAAVIYLKRTLVDNTGVLASVGSYPVTATQTRQCPHCWAIGKQSYLFCPVCGTSHITAPVKSESVASAVEESTFQKEQTDEVAEISGDKTEIVKKKPGKKK